MALRPPLGATLSARSRVPVPTITPLALDRLSYRYPVPLVDAVVSHERGRALDAVKNVTVSEDFFQGHFPGQPVMPGVLMIESLAQAAAILLLDRDGEPLETRASLRGVDGVKFRRQIVPGDRVRLEVRLIAERGPIARVAGQALVDDQVVAEATLVMALERDGVVDPSDRQRRPGARSSAPARRSARTRSSGRTSGSGGAARSARRRWSTATPSSATTTRSSRSPRSACGRRT